MVLDPDDPVAVAATAALHASAVEELQQLLAANPGLATARLGDPEHGMSRTLLHVVTDWPANRPRAAESIAVLVAAGADPDARFTGPHTETPLHWAASADDVAALDALLDAGADIDAPGAVLGGGTPLADATGFAQWKAARRLVERGATASLFDAAALGLLDRVEALLGNDPAPTTAELDAALWGGCHGGQLAAARRLAEAGADPWLPAPWDGTTPRDAAARSGAADVVAWLDSLAPRAAR